MSVIGLKYLRNVVLYDPTGSLYDGGVGGCLGILRYLSNILKYLRIVDFFAPQAKILHYLLLKTCFLREISYT